MPSVPFPPSRSRALNTGLHPGHLSFSAYNGSNLNERAQVASSGPLALFRLFPLSKSCSRKQAGWNAPPVPCLGSRKTELPSRREPDRQRQSYRGPRKTELPGRIENSKVRKRFDAATAPSRSGTRSVRPRCARLAARKNTAAGHSLSKTYIWVFRPGPVRMLAKPF